MAGTQLHIGPVKGKMLFITLEAQRKWIDAYTMLSTMMLAARKAVLLNFCIGATFLHIIIMERGGFQYAEVLCLV